MKQSEAEKRFDVSMNLLDDAIDNVIWNSEYTGMSEILIDYLRDTANRIECYFDDMKKIDTEILSLIDDETEEY